MTPPSTVHWVSLPMWAQECHHHSATAFPQQQVHCTEASAGTTVGTWPWPPAFLPATVPAHGSLPGQGPGATRELPPTEQRGALLSRKGWDWLEGGFLLTDVLILFYITITHCYTPLLLWAPLPSTDGPLCKLICTSSHSCTLFTVFLW